MWGVIQSTSTKIYRFVLNYCTYLAKITVLRTITYHTKYFDDEYRMYVKKIYIYTHFIKILAAKQVYVSQLIENFEDVLRNNILFLQKKRTFKK